MTDAWDPERYSRFAAERSEPFFALLALVTPTPGGRAVDLGCGSGDLTRELHRRTGAAETLGLDSSEAMLARAAPLAGDGLRFERADIGAFAPERPFDLIFSNAALHWVPDHASLLERLTRALVPGGQLAFQVPDNFDHPSHRTAQRTAREEAFRAALAGVSHPRNVLAPEVYARILDDLGFREQTVRLQVFGHRLASREELVTWVEGTLLTFYKERLSEALYARFLETYRARLFAALPDQRPFFLPFRRILVRGRR